MSKSKNNNQVKSSSCETDRFMCIDSYLDWVLKYFNDDTSSTTIVEGINLFANTMDFINNNIFKKYSSPLIYYNEYECIELAIESFAENITKVVNQIICKYTDSVGSYFSLINPGYTNEKLYKIDRNCPKIIYRDKYNILRDNIYKFLKNQYKLYNVNAHYDNHLLYDIQSGLICKIFDGGKTDKSVSDTLIKKLFINAKEIVNSTNDTLDLYIEDDLDDITSLFIDRS